MTSFKALALGHDVYSSCQSSSECFPYSSLSNVYILTDIRKCNL